MSGVDTQTMQGAAVRDPAQEDQTRQQEIVDFKMVTFSLGGKDYGIDIMRVKEIAKFTQFTYVPNTAPFVRGVYNLRGDIISVIDLRLMFNLAAEQKREGDAENGLILRLENNLIGVIVDSIDKVVGIASSQVQPPHPIFGDINVKYISGVAEHDNRLYIILDADSIFSREADEDEARKNVAREVQAPIETASPTAPLREVEPERVLRDESSIQKTFVADGLKAFADFHVTPINTEWFDKRMDRWIEERSSRGEEVQLSEGDDAAVFLKSFFSAYTGAFWQKEYVREFLSVVPEPTSGIIHVWNPGCGDGHESYSLASAIKKHFPDRQVKIWAGDKDLMKISTAPNLVFSPGDVPEEWRDLIVEGRNGHTFVSSIKEAVLFEFSDVLNSAGMPKMDLIVARDLLSFHSDGVQRKIVENFEETLKPGGILMLGDNERVTDISAWEEITGDALSVYRRR